jgi:hypothetical protein
MKMYKPFKIKSSGGSPAGYGEGSSEADVSLVGKRPENESEGVMSRFADLSLITVCTGTRDCRLLVLKVGRAALRGAWR